jgi:multiple antibiotic resistance protein
MIFPKTIDAGVSTKKTSDIVSIAVVPLAIPIGAGPGVIAFLIENSERYHSLMGKLCLTFICLLVCIAAGMILFYARTISKKMGDTGVQTLSRVVGLIIASLGTGMLARAITGFFPSIH